MAKAKNKTKATTTKVKASPAVAVKIPTFTCTELSAMLAAKYPQSDLKWHLVLTGLNASGAIKIDKIDLLELAYYFFSSRSNLDRQLKEKRLENIAMDTFLKKQKTKEYENEISERATKELALQINFIQRDMQKEFQWLSDFGTKNGIDLHARIITSLKNTEARTRKYCDEYNKKYNASKTAATADA